MNRKPRRKPRPPAGDWHPFELYAICGRQPNGLVAVVMLPVTTAETGPTQIPAVGGPALLPGLRQLAEQLAVNEGQELLIVQFQAGLELERFSMLAKPSRVLGDQAGRPVRGNGVH